jgi:L-histidine N-alpha-methyltransferase
MKRMQSQASRVQRERITLEQLSAVDPLRSLADDVRAGLAARPKSLPPKYFYDETGSWLFEEICKTPEYYLTRTEDALLAEVAERVIETVRPARILELGSGSSRKTGHLLRACGNQRCHARYESFDVCSEMLLHAAEHLVSEHLWLNVDAFVGDYLHDLQHIEDGEGTRLVLFLGSTIGNFAEDEATSFLRGLRSVMSRDDRFLLGLDRVKDTGVLHAAYNDAAGLTAEFNRNLLQVINRELDGGFRPQTFAHRALYNQPQARMEMYLDSLHAQRVPIRALSMEVQFGEGESMLTEISRKFTAASMSSMLAQGGFVAEQHFESEDGYFSLVLARARDM